MGVIKLPHSSIALTSSTARIEIPFIKVKIGDFTFGTPVVYVNSKNRSRLNKQYLQYPNFVKSLTITKINGQVNQYNLSLVYPIKPGDDPNYFEKIFSSVSDNRKITFSYGDYNVPDYTYKDEVAIMTNISQSFDPKSAIINYTINAVSSAAIGYTCSRYFSARTAKPSDVIIELITDKNSKLVDLFTGLSGLTAEDIRSLNLIDSSDDKVSLDGGYFNELDYIKYLVENMVPLGTKKDKTKTSAFYVFTIHDEAENDTTEEIRNLNGPYFKVKKISQYVEHADAYTLDIGYPTANIITDFRIDDNQAYSIYFNYHEKIAPVSDYVKRLNEQGEWELQYSPTLIAANSDDYEVKASDKTWWSKVTQYPISGSVTLKGLLRPAVLMEYVRLNVIFHGRKHNSSGLYIITKQVDQIDMSGYRTTLSLTRVGGQTGDELDPWYNTGL